MLEAELASIAKRMVEITGVRNIEFDEVADGFSRPSLYFPPVEQDTSQPTFSAFAFNYSLFVKVFDVNTKAATDKADEIVFSINQDRKQIELVNEDGEKTGKLLRIKQLSSKKVEDCTAQIYCTWQSIYPYTATTNASAGSIVRTIGIKEV